MTKIQGFLIGWTNEAFAYAREVSEKCGIEVNVISGYDHETRLLNQAIDSCQSEYLWFLTVGDQILDNDTPHLLAAYMDENLQVGVACPNRQGELNDVRQPHKWHLADGTAIMYRTEVGARYDEEFIFTGYSDLDFGETVQHLGSEVHIYTKTAVLKTFTAYGSFSSFRNAYNVRNRLLLEAKWWWIGPDRWQGVDEYNSVCPPERRIPTMFELAWWPREKLQAFVDSVYIEQPQILLKDNQGTGNEDWSFNWKNQ